MEIFVGLIGTAVALLLLVLLYAGSAAVVMQLLDRVLPKKGASGHDVGSPVAGT